MKTAGDQILYLMEQRPIPGRDLLDVVEQAARAKDVDALPAVLKLGAMSGPWDEKIAIPALHALPAWGERGVQELEKVARSGHYSDVALRILLGLMMSRLPVESNAPKEWALALEYEPAALAEDAWRALRRIVLAQSTDRQVRKRLAMATMILTTKDDEADAEALLWRLLTESPMSLNEEIIARFRALLEQGKTEQEVHEFLEEHPVLLDAGAVEAISKHKLGTEYVTDFVLRQVNGDYILVEIEKSSDRLFTSKGRIHSQLTDALSQVRDFQRWVHDNLAYARTQLPGITRPRGMVVIGRSAELTDEHRRNLDEENFSRRGHVEILTYDDLLERAGAIYANLISPRPARKTRTENHAARHGGRRND